MKKIYNSLFIPASVVGSIGFLILTVFIFEKIGCNKNEFEDDPIEKVEKSPFRDTIFSKDFVYIRETIVDTVRKITRIKFEQDSLKHDSIKHSH